MKTSRTVFATVLVCLVCLVCLASPAAAEDRAAAEQLFRLGAEAYKSGKYDVAVTNFDSAYEHLKAPEIAFSAAQAHRLQYGVDHDPAHLKRARELYQAYVDGAPGGARRKDALVYLERMDEALKQIDPAQLVVVQQKPSIYVSISLDQAQITIDGKPVERYKTIEVEPGDHVVAASAEGYFPQQERIPVGAGQATVAFELKARPATLEIKSQPDARVTVDGRPLLLRGGTTEVPAGTRWITVSARGRKPISREVKLEPGRRLTLDAPLQPTTMRRAVPWVYAGAGALLAGAIGTTVVAIAADFSAADLRDLDPLPEAKERSYEKYRIRRDRFRIASVVLGGAALLTAAAATVLYYTDEPSPDALLRPVEQQPDAGFTPMALGDGLGLGLGYARGF